MLATQSIKAQAQQEGCRQAYTIKLSINEDIKLEKGKGKKSSAAQYFIWSSSHVTATVRDCLKLSAIVHHNLPFSTSAVILPPPSVKPALRLCSCPYYTYRAFLSLCSSNSLSSLLCQYFIHLFRYFIGPGLLG